MLTPVGVTSPFTASALALLGVIGVLVIFDIGHNAMSNTTVERAPGSTVERRYGKSMTNRRVHAINQSNSPALISA